MSILVAPHQLIDVPPEPCHQGGMWHFRIESKFPVMKMSVIEEIGPIEVQAAAGRQATTGEMAEIISNYKTTQHNSVKHKYNYNSVKYKYNYNSVKYKYNYTKYKIQ